MKATFLSRFTPSMMTPEALEALFVQREATAQRIVEHIRESALTPSKHHTLLIGPRGIGKTHLVSVVYHRVVKMKDLADRMVIAWLREEEWGITNFLDLLLRILRALSEGADNPLAERVESVYELPPKEAARSCATLLREFVGERTLLLIVENLDELFNGLGEEGQQRFRAYLQENPFCTIVATAQSLFNGISLQTSPFYGFFRVQHLEELRLDEAMQLLTNIASFEGDRELVSALSTPMGRARMRAVHHLAGGNHRVYVIFSQFLTRETLEELVEALMRTVDDVTPYYQARMAWLSPQQRKIVELLCERRHAVPVKEVSQRCFMTHQTASSQLKALRDMAYVRSTPVGRESYYELREPLMRLSVEVKKHRARPVRLLVDFLRLWYSQTELRQQLSRLEPVAALDRDYLLEAIRACDDFGEDPRVAACLKDNEQYVESRDFQRALETAEELVVVRGSAEDWAEKAHCLAHLGRNAEALEACDEAIHRDGALVMAWAHRGWILGKLERHEESLAACEQAAGLSPRDWMTWSSVGIAQGELGRHQDALVAFDKALKLKPARASLHRLRGRALEHLGRYDEALKCLVKATEVDPQYARAWYDLAHLFRYLDRNEEALGALDSATNADSTIAAPWHLRGRVLADLERYEEAVSCFEKALQLSDKCHALKFDRAVSLLELGRVADCLAALDAALVKFAKPEDLVVVATTEILATLLRRQDIALWGRCIPGLIHVYEKHGATAALAHALVRNVPVIVSQNADRGAAQKCIDIWRDAVGGREEFQLPLRLLDAAISYQDAKDPRILLQLPAEERELLRPLIGAGTPATE